MACKNISLQLWMAMIFMTIGLILQVVSFAAPYWNDFGDEHWGLWQICDKHGCENIASHHNISNTMQIGRGCQVLGLLCYIIVAVLLIIHVIFKQTKRCVSWTCDLKLLTSTVIIAFVALFSLLIGAILWSTGSNTTLSWCYYLCYFSGLSASATGGVLIYVRRQEFMATIEKRQSIDAGAV